MARDFTIIIPSRYQAHRFPGKALALIHGKTMIQHVYERCRLVAADVHVATDDNRIADSIYAIGGNVVMTSVDHQNGTSRCLEAATILHQSGADLDVILNIQGDEPYIASEHIHGLQACFDDHEVEMASLAYRVKRSELLVNGEGVYLTMDKDKNALYFSRAIIPYNRDEALSDWVGSTTYFKHIGTYGYTLRALRLYNSLPETELERVEKLEQLRWMSHGYKIRMGITDTPSYCVDTPEDLEKLNKLEL